MNKDKFAMISPEEMRIINEAQQKLTSQCGHQVALIAYDVE